MNTLLTTICENQLLIPKILNKLRRSNARFGYQSKTIRMQNNNQSTDFLVSFDLNINIFIIFYEVSSYLNL